MNNTARRAKIPLLLFAAISAAILLGLFTIAQLLSLMLRPSQSDLLYAGGTPTLRLLPRRAPPTPTCPSGLSQLDAETVTEEPGEFWYDFLVSPRGERIALRTRDGITVLDLETGNRALALAEEGFPLLWLDESSLVIIRYQPAPASELDIRSGALREVAIFWEFNGLPAETFVQAYYSVSEAAKLLEVPESVITRAISENRLESQIASDGTRVITRKTLLEQGASLTRLAHPGLLSYDEIGELRSTADALVFVPAVSSQAPIEKAFWQGALIVRRSTTELHTTIVFVSSPSHWDGATLLPNQVTIYGSGTELPDAHPRYRVVSDPCRTSPGGGYRFMLQEKGTDQLLGYLPCPDGYGVEMAWSPDDAFVYFGQSAAGRWSLSRVRLP